MWRLFLDVLFPAQCAGCNALGTGLCASCVPMDGGPLRSRAGSIDVIALGPYEGALRQAVLALKDGRRDVAEALGERLARFLERGETAVPIPTTRKRRRIRGIDGVACVARRAAWIAGATAVTALEQCTGDAQRGRSRAQRLAASGRFACDAALVTAKMVVLIDDVCTTGATIEDCARAVRDGGGTVRRAIVAARADGTRDR